MQKSLNKKLEKQLNKMINSQLSQGMNPNTADLSGLLDSTSIQTQLNQILNSQFQNVDLNNIDVQCQVIGPPKAKNIHPQKVQNFQLVYYPQELSK